MTDDALTCPTRRAPHVISLQHGAPQNLTLAQIALSGRSLLYRGDRCYVPYRRSIIRSTQEFRNRSTALAPLRFFEAANEGIGRHTPRLLLLAFAGRTTTSRSSFKLPPCVRSSTTQRALLQDVSKSRGSTVDPSGCTCDTLIRP